MSDEGLNMAFPYETLSNNKKLVEEVNKICQKERVSLVVIGESKTLSGKDNPIMKDISVFIKRFSKLTEIPVHFEPEFFSTKEALRFKNDRKNKDASAAAIILQRFLERHRLVDNEK